MYSDSSILRHTNHPTPSTDQYFLQKNWSSKKFQLEWKGNKNIVATLLLLIWVNYDWIIQVKRSNLFIRFYSEIVFRRYQHSIILLYLLTIAKIMKVTRDAIMPWRSLEELSIYKLSKSFQTSKLLSARLFLIKT